MSNTRELKKLGRRQLLEIILAQLERIEILEKELNEKKRVIDNFEITLRESGNIAEASLRINEVFEVAQKAADYYLKNVENLCKKIEKEASKKKTSKTKVKENKKIEKSENLDGEINSSKKGKKAKKTTSSKKKGK